jgi:phospholipid N-methyltransferase
LTTLAEAVRTHVLDEVTAALAPRGAMLAIQYSTLRRSLLEERFASIDQRRCALNVSPALVFACREPRQ